MDGRLWRAIVATSARITSPEIREQVHKRLRRIEGQVRGVQRMLDDERDCREIVQQLAAIRSAVQQVGLEVMRTYASQCLNEDEDQLAQNEMLDYLFNTLGKWT